MDAESVLETSDGRTVSAADALRGKVVALYFSASWCPDCKPFTPRLAAAYEMANEEEPTFEVVYVSSDQSADDMARYMADHPSWLHVPFDSPLRRALKVHHGRFGMSESPALPGVARRGGLPSLVVVGRDGGERVSDALAALQQQGPEAVAEWVIHKW